MDISKELFNRKELRNLIIPLMFEQLLAVSIGLVDTLMVSQAGEAAVSGVSLVDGINTLIIQILTALATGGAVVCSQYIGKRENDNAKNAAGQLMTVLAVFSGLIMLLVLFFHTFILKFVFGKIDADVMESAMIYFMISAVSYPFLAIYNAAAALFRVMGNSKVSMLNSLIMNILNIVLNSIFIFVMHLGVLGVALATLMARAFSCIIIMIKLSKGNYVLSAGVKNLIPEKYMIRRILSIGIPSGVENGMFQIGKLSVASLTSTFGTAAIAANAISSNISGFANIPGAAIGLAMITVIGRCVGAGEKSQARYYSKRLMFTAYIGIWITNLSMLIFLNPLVHMFGVSEEACNISKTLLISFSIVAVVLWPLSFSLPNVLRAAGDAKYTMKVSVFSMWVFRVISSYIIAGFLGVGVMGVWIGMYIDWAFRSAFFVYRYIKGKWLDIKII